MANPYPYRGPRPPRSPNRFKAAELTRVMRLARTGNVDVERFEVDPASGRISVIVRGGGQELPKTELDEWVTSMRVRLRGVNRVAKRPADGTLRIYWYAWKGGPPLRGEPGTPEFIASYNEAVARKVTPPRGRLLECAAWLSRTATNSVAWPRDRVPTMSARSSSSRKNLATFRYRR